VVNFGRWELLWCLDVDIVDLLIRTFGRGDANRLDGVAHPASIHSFINTDCCDMNKYMICRA
jgi:hypothetical protein